ncbi:MAG TPA: nucleotide exchange factor GrpE [bacterium]|nr:nucleotide exchange factor GrpE [bacterium]
MSPDDKKGNGIVADIPESVFEEALKAVENIQAQAQQKRKQPQAKPVEKTTDIEIVEEDSEIIDLMEILDDGEAEKKPVAKKPEKAESIDNDLAVLSKLLEDEYNLEKEADFFKNVLFDSMQESADKKIDESLLKEKEGQIQEMAERLTNLRTEFEKFRQRLTKEAEQAKRFSNESLILQLLPILDNLERAIEHAEHSEDKNAMIQGVRLIHKQLLDTFVNVGVKALEAKGKQFDPAYHEAMVMLDTQEVPPNVVISEYQRGYLLFDRLLRPSKVVVSKNPNGVPGSEGELKQAGGDDSATTDPSGEPSKQDG